ncbi:unnamed protein product, partial [marine sediment metagenome]
IHVYKTDEVRKLERLGEIKIERSDQSDSSSEKFDDAEFDDLQEFEEEIPRNKYEIEYPSSFTSSDYETLETV